LRLLSEKKSKKSKAKRKNGELKIIKSVTKLLSFVVILYSFSLFAGDFSGSITVGSSWQNDADYLSLRELAESGRQKKAALFLDTGAELEYSLLKESLLFSYSVLSKTARDLRVSTVRQSLKSEYSDYILDNIFYELNLAVTHIKKDYSAIKNDVIFPIANSTLFFEPVTFTTLYLNLRAAYYTGLSKDVKYITGPAAGAETGAYIFPYSEKFKGKIFVAIDLFRFKSEEFDFHNNKMNNSGGTTYGYDKYLSSSIEISNRYNMFTLQSEFSYSIQKTTIFLKGKYVYYYWLGKNIGWHYVASNEPFYDEKMMSDSKPRRENLYQGSLGVEYEILSFLYVSLGYTYSLTESNYRGEIEYHAADFVKFGGINHELQFAVEYWF